MRGLSELQVIAEFPWKTDILDDVCVDKILTGREQNPEPDLN